MNGKNGWEGYQLTTKLFASIFIESILNWNEILSVMDDVDEPTEWINSWNLRARQMHKIIAYPSSKADTFIVFDRTKRKHA